VIETRIRPAETSPRCRTSLQAVDLKGYALSQATRSAKGHRQGHAAAEEGVIVPADPDAAPKLMRYLPFWAAGAPEGQT
jgi:hypothetical protein